MGILQCVSFSGYVPLRRGRLISATWRRTPSRDFQGITFSAELSLEMIHTHVMSVVVIHGVTGIPHHRPSATSVFSHSTYHSAAHTAYVMPSVDSIRRESHAAKATPRKPRRESHAAKAAARRGTSFIHSQHKDVSSLSITGTLSTGSSIMVWLNLKYANNRPANYEFKTRQSNVFLLSLCQHNHRHHHLILCEWWEGWLNRNAIVWPTSLLAGCIATLIYLALSNKASMSPII